MRVLVVSLCGLLANAGDYATPHHDGDYDAGHAKSRPSKTHPGYRAEDKTSSDSDDHDYSVPTPPPTPVPTTTTTTLSPEDQKAYQKAQGDWNSEQRWEEHVSKTIASAQRASQAAAKGEKDGKLKWEAQMEKKDKRCRGCHPGCLLNGRCQKHQRLGNPMETENKDVCLRDKGEWCEVECSRTKGDGASAVYPCMCGAAMCETYDLCYQNVSKCVVNRQEIRNKKQAAREKDAKHYAGIRVEREKKFSSIKSATEELEAKAEKKKRDERNEKHEAEEKREAKHRAAFFKYQKVVQERDHKSEMKVKKEQEAQRKKAKEEEEKRKRTEDKERKELGQEHMQKVAEGHAKKLTVTQELTAKTQEAIAKRNATARRVQEANAKYDKEHDVFKGKWEDIIKKDEVAVRTSQTTVVVAQAKHAIAEAENQKDIAASLRSEIIDAIHHLTIVQKKLADDKKEAISEGETTKVVAVTKEGKEQEERAKEEKASKDKAEKGQKKVRHEKVVKGDEEAKKQEQAERKHEQEKRDRREHQMEKRAEAGEKAAASAEKAAEMKGEADKKVSDKRVEKDAKAATSAEEKREEQVATTQEKKEERDGKHEALERRSDRAAVNDAQERERKANEKVTKAEAAFENTATKAESVKKEAIKKASSTIAAARKDAEERIARAKSEAGKKISHSHAKQAKYDAETEEHRREIVRMQEKDKKRTAANDRADLGPIIAELQKPGNLDAAEVAEGGPSMQILVAAAAAMVAAVVMSAVTLQRRASMARRSLESSLLSQ